ncbi:MAG: AIPR family protein [Burkholderiaceae bacterium]|nr:AIPR family protein [Burkholderiaceae bacterium]
MELSVFLMRLRGEVADEIALRSASPGAVVAFPEQVFTDVFTRYMVEAGLTSAPLVCNYDARFQDGRARLSGYALSADSERLDLFISLYFGVDTLGAISDTEVRGATDECARFLRLCVNGTLSACVDESHDAYPLIQTVMLAFNDISQVRMYVITDGTTASAPMPSLKIFGKEVLTDVVDAAALCDGLQDSRLHDDFRSLSNFRNELLSAVHAAAELRHETVVNTFVEDTGARLADAEEIPDFQRCQFLADGPNGSMLRIDGYAFDEADASLSLVVADFSEADELQLIAQPDIYAISGSLRLYAEAALEGRLGWTGSDADEAGIGLAVDIAARRAEINRVRLYVVTDRLSEPVDLPTEAEIAGIPTELHVWDIARFHKASVSESGKDHFEVDFRLNGSRGLDALHAGSACGDYEGYLCTIQGDVLAAVYDQYGGRLLEGNVRSFLSIKGKINAGIQVTISEKPTMFFAYNNGIAATADEVILDTYDTLRIAKVRNFQIVNGGQTTASLAAASRAGADLSKIVVQMKLSVLPPKKAGELIPLIARFANSQNKVSESDFFANHPYHVRLEQLSKRLPMPDPTGVASETYWYYERARGQYLNDQKSLGKEEKADFLRKYPKHQLLTKLDVARLENTWKGLPHKVSNGAQKNFLFFAGWLSKAWTKDDDGFDERYFRNLVAMAILYQHTEVLIAQQSWYQGAYRPNIISYSLALLQFMILQKGKGRQLDLNRIWQTQTVPEPLSALLASLSAIVFSVLTSPERLKANVTEWAKSEMCWERVRAVAPPLGNDVFSLLEDPATMRARDADAAIDDKIGYGIFASAAVKGIDAAVWSELLRWGDGRNLLNAMEIRLLRSATRLPRFSPSVTECEKIWSIRAKLIKGGFGQV